MSDRFLTVQRISRDKIVGLVKELEPIQTRWKSGCNGVAGVSLPFPLSWDCWAYGNGNVSLSESKFCYLKYVMALSCMISLLILRELGLSILKRRIGCRRCFALLEVQINSFVLHDCAVACYSLLLSI